MEFVALGINDLIFGGDLDQIKFRPWNKVVGFLYLTMAYQI